MYIVSTNKHHVILRIHFAIMKNIFFVKKSIVNTSYYKKMKICFAEHLTLSLNITFTSNYKLDLFQFAQTEASQIKIKI